MSKLRRILVMILVTALIVPVLAAGCGESRSQGQQQYEKAQELEEQHMLTKATAGYKSAMAQLEKEGKTELATQARMALQRINLFELTYPDLAADVKKKLAEAYPQVPQAERDRWLSSGEMEHTTWDGKVRYMGQAVDNIATRHLDVSYLNQQKNALLGDFVTGFIDKVIHRPAVTWQPYSNPFTYLGTETVNVPRAELPKTGVFKMWFPLPVVTGPQDSVTISSITPATYVKQPPSTNAAISLAYMEVPLDQLQGDLNVSVQFQFTHYQENFQVDPNNVGAYDRSSTLYKQYTRSYGNTYISPAIRETAKKVVGNEKNPYLQAKKLYDYIVKDIKYSFMPHATMWPRGERESVYVHRMKRGDCGAQGMYFSSLCRSLGIPARTTGGWQLLMGDFASHFWSEFYLPNYGWVPVDPTAAEMADWTNAITGEQRQEYQQFFFANQDPMRCNVQLDVDEPLIPPATEEVFLPLAIQNPVATCSTMTELPSIVLAEHYTLHAQLLSPAGQ
jgi:transglutaminase-like putative cysteine protease